MNTMLTPPYPQGGAISFPQLSQRGPVPPGTVPAGSEFDQANWRSTLAALGRINLNRQLTAFPPPDNTGVVTAANQAQALQALADRQQFASDIFTRLVQGDDRVSNSWPGLSRSLQHCSHWSVDPVSGPPLPGPAVGQHRRLHRHGRPEHAIQLVQPDDAHDRPDGSDPGVGVRHRDSAPAHQRGLRPI